MLTDEQLKALESAQSGSTDDTLELGNIEIDLSDYGAAQESLSISGCEDVITISASDYSSMNTITLPTMSTSYISTGAIGAGATVGGLSYNTSGSSTWSIGSLTGINSNSNVNISEQGIDLNDKCDIKIGDRSLKDFITKMEQRLSILVPDPEKLEKFEALKKAYEHYKTMEALCFPEPEEEDKE